MSQSLLYHAFGVREGYEYRRTSYEGCGVQFHVVVKDDLLVCPQCGSRAVVRMGRRTRRLRTVPIGLKPTTLVVEVPRCRCHDCGKHFAVSPPLPAPM
jgi:transposase